MLNLLFKDQNNEEACKLLAEMASKLQEKEEMLEAKEKSLKSKEESLKLMEATISMQMDAVEADKQRAEEYYYRSNDEIVDLNVGGEYFTTFKSTLFAFKDTFFTSIFSGRWSIIRDSKGKWFIDRDPEMFKHILNAMRTGIWPVLSSEIERYALELELDYYCLVPHFRTSNEGFEIQDTHKHRIFLIGGTNGWFSNEMEAFDTETWSWIKRASMSTARYCFAAVTIKNTLIVLGGSHSKNNVVESWNPIENSWTEIGTTNCARFCFACVSNNKDKVFVLGGRKDWEYGDRLDSIECYRPAINKWTQLKHPLTSPRSSLAAVMIEQNIFVIGGMDGKNIVLNILEKYDLEKRQWQKLASMKNARYNHAAAALNGKIYAVGGFSASGKALRSVEEYNPKTDSWIEVDLMRGERAWPAVTASNSKLWVFGGSNGRQLLNTVECYCPKEKFWTTVGTLSSPKAGAAAIILDHACPDNDQK